LPDMRPGCGTHTNPQNCWRNRDRLLTGSIIVGRSGR
jgi:hypothetical protein